VGLRWVIYVCWGVCVGPGVPGVRAPVFRAPMYILIVRVIPAAGGHLLILRVSPSVGVSRRREPRDVWGCEPLILLSYRAYNILSRINTI
jgi:hypothetical protein